MHVTAGDQGTDKGVLNGGSDNAKGRRNGSQGHGKRETGGIHVCGNVWLKKE